MTKTLRLLKKHTLLLLTIFAVQGIFAQTIRYVNASVSGGSNNGTTWANAYKDLQPALAAAQTGDQIWVAKGTYYPTISTTDRTASFVMKNNLGIYGGFAGYETALNQRNWTTNLTTLSGDIDHATDPLVVMGSGSTLSITGNTANSYHVVYTTNSTANALNKTAILDGFTVSGGNACDAFSDSSGGGILIYFSSPTLANLVFTSNNAYHYGGGLYDYASSPSLSNVIFTGNNVIQYEGGGLCNVYSSPIVTNCQFLGNSGPYGGGMFNFNSSPNVAKSFFIGNNGISGGGMNNYSNSSPTITNVVFSGNFANSGGGMYNTISSAPNLTNVVFFADSALYGGGIYNYSSAPNLTNVEFVQNGANFFGGGMYNIYNSSPTLVNTTFLGNNAVYKCGSIYNTVSTISIANSIFWNNTVTYPNASSYPIITGYDIGNDNSSTTTVANTALQLVSSSYGSGFVLGSGNLFAQNPKFVNAANPAGLDGVFGTADDGLTLFPCSPAVNTGNNTVVPSTAVTDISGANRVQGSAVDMGAYEFSGINNGNPSSADFIAVDADVSNTIITSGQTTTMMVDGSNCKSIATLQSNGSNPVNGNVTAKVWVDASVQADAAGKPYLQRHYQITPASNTTTATATVTLYFLQSEFTAYNASANVNNGIYPKLPVDVTDAANYRANLKFDKISGASSDGSGAPNKYSGSATLMTPTSVLYNNSTSRWEATVSLAGFSGFFGTTGNSVLPVSWLNFTATLNGQQQAQINWQVSEVNVADYAIEKSWDGVSFNTIGSITSKGDGINNYSFIDASLLQSGIIFYRIRQTDKDGKSSYSATVQLSTAYQQLFSVHPNPAKNILHVATSGIKGDLQLVDVVGHVLMSVTITGNKTDIDITRLASGAYYCKAVGKSILFVKE